MKAVIMTVPDRTDCIFFFQHGGTQPSRAHTDCARKARWATADNNRVRTSCLVNL
jgi:hypothetical protein